MNFSCYTFLNKGGVKMHWLTKDWWVYLLGKTNGCGLLTAAICRAKGHPCGVVWDNPSGSEPDMTCKNCGDDLG